MYVAPGLLDQRLRLYTREDGGADGFQRPVYVYAGEFWGRIDATADTQTVPLAPQGHVEGRTSAVAFLNEAAPVDGFGLLRVDSDGPLYFVRGIVKVRQLRLLRVDLEAIDPTAYGEFMVYEDADVLDGIHLVNPMNGIPTTSAFSDGFSEGFA
jgi:hypothetical protein